MSRLYIYCEGQTEFDFVKKMLVPFFESRDIYATPILAGDGYHGKKGGIASYSQIKREIKKLCYEHSNEWVTTMIDYSPEIDLSLTYDQKGDMYDIARSKERAIEDDLNLPNLLMNFELHEFEAYLYCNPDAFAIYDCKAPKKIEYIVRKHNGQPELINTNPNTLPSRRLDDVIPGYTKSKVYNTNQLLENISLEQIRSKCEHFDAWLERVCNNCKDR